MLETPASVVVDDDQLAVHEGDVARAAFAIRDSAKRREAGG